MKKRLLFLSLLMSFQAQSAEIGSKPTAPTVRASPGARVAPTKAVRPRDNGVAATVRTDGAMVYSKPDFDADVLTTLKQGDHVRVSSGVLGDYAKFHKVAAGAVVGWIADIDVQVEGAQKKRDHKRGANGKKEKTEKKPKKPFVDESMPILFTKYVGLLIGTTEFNEAITGIDAHETLLIYGLKITGPDVLLRGPVTDVNLMLHYGAPGYYNSLSSTKPTGFVFMADALLLYPFLNHDKAMVAFGVGPLLKYSSFSVTNGGNLRSLSELDAGASVALSGAAKFGKIAVRLEGKMLFEKHQERLFQLAVQQQF